MTEPPDHRPALVWFTRDLRLADQPALHAAIASGRKLVACFVWEGRTGRKWSPGGAHLWWMHHSLTSLAADLKHAGLDLVLRKGESVPAIEALVRETDAAELHVGAPIEPDARAALQRLGQSLPQLNCTLTQHLTRTLFDPESIRTQTGTVFGVYTPFSKACRARGLDHEPLPTPRHIPAAKPPTSDRLDSWKLLPKGPDWSQSFAHAWQVGEHAAHQRLSAFIADHVRPYDTRRNFPGEDSTSRMSPHLHWGEISARAIWAATASHQEKGAVTYLNELLWREFSSYLLWHHPDLPDENLRRRFDAMPWRSDPPALAAWQQGRTGVPLVDAGMRQLWQIGWLHNRIRMVVASFLIKHLMIDWRDGEAWFWDCLVDGDLGSNSASWQWVAGSGADAAPFFRVFNPILQGLKFDPGGDYVREWVPELRALPTEHIHAPHEAPAAILQAAGVELGRNYPQPIVDLKLGRDRALAAFAALPD